MVTWAFMECNNIFSSRPDGWTDYMGAIFEYLHQNNVTKENILDCMKEIPFVKGEFPNSSIHHSFSKIGVQMYDCNLFINTHDKVLIFCF